MQAIESHTAQAVDRRAGLATVCAVVVAALVVRVGSAWRHGVLANHFQFDESVYFLGAQHLSSGQLPYRDFLFVHPPGILVTLTPSAWLSELIGDSLAMTISKVAFAVIGAACAGLVAWLLLEFGRFAALVGGGLYAVWSATVFSETALMMEPLLSLTLLSSLLLIRRSSGLPYAGFLLGLAVTIKLWALVTLTVLAIWVIVRYRRQAIRFAIGVIVGVAVVVIPFAIAAPGAMFSQVIEFQSQRPRSGIGFGERAYYFTGSVLGYPRLPDILWLLVGVVAVLAVAAPLINSARLRRRPQQWEAPVWWSVLALARLAALAIAPSFYETYAGFSAATLCLLLGYGIHVLRLHLARPGRRVLTIAIALGLLVLALSTSRVVSGGNEQPAGLATAVAGYSCVWMQDPAALIEADVAGNQIDRECPMLVDRYATLVGETQASDHDVESATPTATEYQRVIADQFRGSDAVVISSPQLDQLSPATRAVLNTEFTHVRDIGHYQIWERSPS